MLRVKDVVNRVLNAMDSLPQDAEEADFLAELEVAIFTETLMKLLKDDAYALNASPATTDNLQAFFDFLNDRWKFIEKTDSSYCHSPYSRFNQICTLLANELKTNLRSAYEILMPTLNYNNYQFPGRGNLSNLKLHEFILDDEGDPIWVAQTLTMDCNNDKHENDPFALLMRQSPKDRLVRSSSWFENERIKNHSPITKKFSRLMQSADNIEKNKEWLCDSFNSDDYVVTASYGEEGRKKLLNGILATAKTPHEFGALFKHMRKEKWQAFLTEVKDEDLFNLLLGINYNDLKAKFSNAPDSKKILAQKIDEALQKKLQELLSNDYEDETETRGLLFSLREVYKRYRPHLPDYKTTPGSVFGSMLPKSSSYSKEEKMGSITSFTSFNLSDHPLEDLEGYLKVNGLSKHLGALTHSSYASWLSTYLAPPSTLALLTGLAKNMGEKLRKHALRKKV